MNVTADILVYKILIPFIIHTAPIFKEALQPVINLNATDKYCKAVLEHPENKTALYKTLLYNDKLASMLSAITTAKEAQKILLNIAENSNLINECQTRDSSEDLLYINQFVVNELKYKGASLNSGITPDNSPLLIAITRHNQPYFIKALLVHKADVNQRNNKGSTPLMMARKHGKNDVYTMLLNYGADLNAQDNDGHTVYCCYYTYLNNNS